MTAKLDAIGSDTPDAGLRAVNRDDPLAIFPPEPQEVGDASGDSAALRMESIRSPAAFVPFATPNVIDGKPRPAGVIDRLKRVFRALDIARDIEKTVDNRLAALSGLDQEVQDRARRLELLNQEIIAGAGRADDVLRAIGSLEQPLAELRRRTQDLQALETTVAAFENRAQIVSTSLDRQLAASEARKAAVVDAVEQLGRRAADTIGNLERRVGDCEARADTAERTITQLCDASSRTLPVLQERAKEAEEQNRSLAQLVSEAVRTAASLTALEERLPAVDQCDQDLARIELAVPQIAQQIEDLYARAEQQSRALAVHQQRVRQTLDESQKTAAVVSELEARIVDLSGSHQQLDRLEECIAQLEQRAAAAAGEVRHAARAKDELQREIAKCHQQIERLTMAVPGEAGIRKELRQHAAFQEANRASSHSPQHLLITLRFRRRVPNTSRAFAPTRPIFASAALALSAAIVLLVGTVWRISPAENQQPGGPLRSPVLASRALTLAPTFAVAPATQLTADSSDDRPEAARPAPAVPAVSVPRVVVSGTLLATRGVPTAAPQEQSVSKGVAMPRFVGTLLIESDPAGAAVFVNQESVGATPVLLKDMRAGSYVVRLEYEGYQRWSTSATVSAVREERVKAKLERERSR